MHRGVAYVEVDAERVVARFGFFRAETLLSNVERWDITGPYRWWRAVGVRGSMGKPELTFGGSAHAGLCLHLREPIRIARIRVRDLYVTVDDVAALGRDLTAYGIPGKDLRSSGS